MNKIPETAPFMSRFMKGQPVGLFPRITLPVCIESIVWLIYASTCAHKASFNQHLVYSFLLAILLHNLWFLFSSVLILHNRTQDETGHGLTFREVITEVRKALAYDNTIPLSEWSVFRVWRIPYTDAYRILWVSLITVTSLYR